MNPRERLLLVALIAVVGCGGFSIGTYLWFVKPALANRKTIQTMRAENELESARWDQFMHERKKLELAKLKSLPLNPGEAASDYGNYLERMIAQTGLKLNTITPSPATKIKPVSALPNVKETGHLLMTFTLTARGELADLVKFMELIRATPYEHRIKSLSVDRADMAPGKNAAKTLVISMVIETLLIAKNENQLGHPPGVDPRIMIADHIAGRSMDTPMGWGLIGTMVVHKTAVPTPEDRHYGEIAGKNIFVGWMPVIKTGGTGPPPPPPVPKAPGNIPAFIRLVHTVPSQNEAYLINLYYKNEEIRFSGKPDSGYQVQRIADATGDYIFFYMKVLRVDSGMMHFQIENHVFTIKLGQTLNDAIQAPLSIDRMDDLDLDWDREWAREQMGDKVEEKAPAKKKTGK